MEIILAYCMAILTAALSCIGLRLPIIDSTYLTAAQDALLQDVTIMSFNVYVAGAGKHKPDNRRQPVLQTILEHAPDSVGLQEADEGWRESVKALEAQGYACVGTGRDKDGKGEASLVLYNSRQYDLLDSGTFWLSKTPEKPSRAWDASMRRVCSWALLKDKGTGFTYAHFNAHLDHLGVISRIKSVQVILEQMADLVAPEVPVVLTGDFNCEKNSLPYKIVTQNGMYDTAEIADKADEGGTYHAYSGRARRVLDYIFASPHVRKVHSYQIITEKKDGIYPSDHYPVVSKLTLAMQEKMDASSFSNQLVSMGS